MYARVMFSVLHSSSRRCCPMELKVRDVEKLLLNEFSFSFSPYPFFAMLLKPLLLIAFESIFFFILFLSSRHVCKHIWSHFLLTDCENGPCLQIKCQIIVIFFTCKILNSRIFATCRDAATVIVITGI